MRWIHTRGIVFELGKINKTDKCCQMFRDKLTRLRDYIRAKPCSFYLLLLVALLLLLYVRLLVYPSHYVWFDHWDMCQLGIPRANFVANSIHNGHFPLWDPHIWTGLPVLGSAQPGPVFPLTLLLEVLPLQNGKISFLSLNVVFFLQRLLIGFFALLLFRELGIRGWAAAIGGVVFAAGGYVGSIPWLDVLNGMVCVPAIALFAIRLARDPKSVKSAALLGLALGLCWLSGHHEIPLLTTYVLLGFIAWRMVRRGMEQRRVDYRMLAMFALSLVLGAAISSVQTLPLVEFGHHAKRWVSMPEPIGWNERVPYEIHQRYSLQWSNLLDAVCPGATTEGHTTIFLGIAVTTLALWGLLTTWRTKVTQALALGAGLSVLYALGGNTPFHHILYTVLPGLEKARTPSRGLFIFALAIAALASIGLEKLLSGRPRRRHFLALLSAVLLATVAIAHFDGTAKVYRLESSNYLTLAFLAALLLCGSCVPKIPRWAQGALVVAAVMLELTTIVSLRVSPVSSSKSVCAADLTGYDSLAASLRERLQGGRFALQYDTIRTSLGDLYQLDQFSSFVAGVPADLLDLDVSSPRTQQLLGVAITLSGTRPPTGALPAAIKISQQPALPRAWVSHSVIAVNSSAELREKVADESVRFPQTAILLDEPVLSLSNEPVSEPVTVEHRNSDHVVMRVNLASRGLVTLSAVDYPGWEAAIDGRSTRIVRTYGAFRGVVAEPGSHVIEMRYRPSAVYWGGLLSLLGLLATLVLLVYTSRTSRNQ